MTNIRHQIVKILLEFGVPSSLKEISTRSNESPQLLTYHIGQLVKDGIILKEDGNGTPTYQLQKIFYNEEIRNYMKYSLLGLLLLTTDEIDKDTVKPIDVLYYLLDIVKSEFNE